MNRLLSIVVLLLCFFGTAAQTNDKQKKDPELWIYANVCDFLTQNGVDTMQVVMMTAKDSVVVDTAKIDKWTHDDRISIDFNVKVKKPGDYLFRIESEGYKTKYVPLSLPKLRRNEQYRHLPTIYLQKERKKWDVELDELVVKASKVKFFMDGDTLVYNADAFDLAEGSMLDALIRKLPGVELKKGGQILVNGKEVSELQLNGNELMGSDNSMMLENLPAFMVKNVKVYERAPKEVKGTRKEKTTPKETVMNVRLKREYQKGWIANVEGGISPFRPKNNDSSPLSGGEDKVGYRWLGRAFASRFSDMSRLSLYASANNVNNYNTPGEQGDWSQLEQSEGITNSYIFGVTGSAHTKEEVTQYNGNAELRYSETDYRQRSNSEQFYEGGNTFGRSMSQSRNYNFNVFSYHSLRYHQSTKPTWNMFKSVYANASADISYGKSTSNGQNGAATLNADVAEQWGKEWIDSLLSPQMGDLLQKHAITRTINRSRTLGEHTNGSASLWSYVVPLYNDKIIIRADAGYSYSDNNTDAFSATNYDATAITDADKRQERYNGSFTRTSDGHVAASAHFGLGRDGNHELEFGYRYAFTNTRSNTPIYLLHKLDRWNSTEHSLGDLPSMDEMMSVMDKDNSEWSHRRINTHRPRFGYGFQHYNDSTQGLFYVEVGAEMPITNERIDYRKSSLDTLLTRNTLFLNPSFSLYIENYKTGFHINAGYDMSSEAPGLTQMVDLVDTSNPLSRVYGNKDLKTTRNHNFRISYRDRWKGMYQFHSWWNMTITENAVAMGHVFDRTTGMSTMKPESVNGNWNMSANVGATVPFDKKQKYILDPEVSYTYTNSVDLSSTTGAPARSVVGTHNIVSRLRFAWKLTDKLEFGAKGELNLRNSTSEREDFQSIHSSDFNYGATAQLELPLGLQFSTDLTMYSRRGYNDVSMNTNELVWNARLSKKIKNWSIMLDALDIFRNLSNVRYNINAQGRTETYTNIIPSYTMLHVVWRLNKKPKK